MTDPQTPDMLNNTKDQSRPETSPSREAASGVLQRVSCYTYNIVYITSDKLTYRHDLFLCLKKKQPVSPISVTFCRMLEL